MPSRPCSGVRMLWVGTWLALALACALEFRASKTALAVVCAVGAVLIGNVFRSSALFYVEAGVVRGPEWLHEGVGVVVFVGTAAAIVACVRGIDFGRPWQGLRST